MHFKRAGPGSIPISLTTSLKPSFLISLIFFPFIKSVSMLALLVLTAHPEPSNLASITTLSLTFRYIVISSPQ